MYEMSNSCLETSTRACIHWLAVKCAVILCSDMSRKRAHTIPSISRHFYSLFFSLLLLLQLLLHPFVLPCTAGSINSPISPFLQDTAKMVSYNTQVFWTGWLCNGLLWKDHKNTDRNVIPSFKGPRNILMQVSRLHYSLLWTPIYLGITFPLHKLKQWVFKEFCTLLT